jgi:hypothetical protein
LSTETKKPAGGSAPATAGPGAFGVALDSVAEIPGLSRSGAAAGSRRANHQLVSREAIKERCGVGMLKPLGSDGEGVDRRKYFQHSTGGELMRTRSYGEHLIADRGRTILSAVEGADTDLWQRFLVGQVLPATASIQGLEVFHASAVAVNGGVIALAGPSGTGKSTLAASLIAAGGGFYVDDVLAVDATTSGITAYPGPELVSLAPAQADALGLGEPVWAISDQKSIFAIDGERNPLPIRAFISLERGNEVSEPEFAPCPPNRLMAMTFDALPRSPERLRRLLRVCAELASDARALHLRFSTQREPDEIAEAVMRRLGLEPA